MPRAPDESDHDSFAARFFLRDDRPQSSSSQDSVQRGPDAQDTSSSPGFDFDEFKRSLGSAPAAKFTSEGGLLDPWALVAEESPAPTVPQSIRCPEPALPVSRQAPVSPRADRRPHTPRNVPRAEAAVDPLELKIRRRQRSKSWRFRNSKDFGQSTATGTTLVMLVAYIVLALCCSKTSGQRPIEPAVVKPNPIKTKAVEPRRLRFLPASCFSLPLRPR